jgi:hypothetical protein
MENYNIIIGKNIKRELIENYKKIKIEKKVIDKL